MNLIMTSRRFRFEKTGVAEIDAILEAIAIASRAAADTDDWNDDVEDFHPTSLGRNPVEWIQLAANEAAQKVIGK